MYSVSSVYVTPGQGKIVGHQVNADLNIAQLDETLTEEDCSN